ncbi:hypothetical protein Tco_1401059 [Tanacetum coccineum]
MKECDVEAGNEFVNQECSVVEGDDEPIENCNVNTEGKVDESQVEVNSEPASSDLPKVSTESDEAVMNDMDIGKEKHENSNGNSSHKAAGNEGIKISYANIASNLDNKLNLIPTEINEDGVEVVIFDEEIMSGGSKK